MSFNSNKPIASCQFLLIFLGKSDSKFNNVCSALFNSERRITVLKFTIKFTIMGMYAIILGNKIDLISINIISRKS